MSGSELKNTTQDIHRPQGTTFDSNLGSLAYHVAMKIPSSLTKFNEYMSQRHPSTQMVVLYRNMGFGGGAICLILLLGIAQIKSGPNPALTISVLSGGCK